MNTRTFWLYHNGYALASVRAPAGATNADVRALAAEQHDAVPACYGTGMAPFEYRAALLRADVRV